MSSPESSKTTLLRGSESAPLDGGQPPTRTKRRYGASCELCRRRKRKCPGRDRDGNSLCTHCAEVGVECIFPQNGQTTRARKVMAAAAAVSEVEKLKDYIKQIATSNPTDRDRLLRQWVADEYEDLPPPESPREGSKQRIMMMSKPTTPTEENTDRPSKRRRMSASSPPGLLEQAVGEDAGDVDVEDNGEEGFVVDKEPDEVSWRPESALRLSLNPVKTNPEADEKDSDENDNIPGSGNPPSLNSTFDQMNAPHILLPSRVDHYIDTIGIHVDDVLPEDRDLLFKNYFCWQNPRNCVVDRALLERAMLASDSKYFTPFLFYSICAHTCRHVPQLRERVTDYAARAITLLTAELGRPSSIPTIQGLILLASHLAARGLYGQSWNLTGTAVAMMTDLGCHLEKPLPEAGAVTGHNQSSSSQSQTKSSKSETKRSRTETLHQMRIRMFWAVFIWDKIISLALSRPAHLSYEYRFPPYPEPKDNSALWIPFLSMDSPPALFSYQPQPGQEDKCFYESCRAYRYLDEIHYHLYHRHRSMGPNEIKEFVSEMGSRLSAWQAEACREVVLDLSSKGTGSGSDSGSGQRAVSTHPPPPHIIQLNLVIRVIWILLYRPFYYGTLTKGPDASTKYSSQSASSTPSPSPSSPPSSTKSNPYPSITPISIPAAAASTSVRGSSSIPFSASSIIPHAITTCERAAAEINTLFLMYEQLYPLSRSTYIIIFAAFLAATIDLALADKQKLGITGTNPSGSDTIASTTANATQRDRELELGGTLGRLALANRVLSGGASVVPGMHSSVAKLQNYVNAMLDGSKGWAGSGQRGLTSDGQVSAPATVNTHAVVAPATVDLKKVDERENEKTRRIWDEREHDEYHHARDDRRQWGPQSHHQHRQQLQQSQLAAVDPIYNPQSQNLEYVLGSSSSSSFASSSVRYEPMAKSYEHQQQHVSSHSTHGHGRHDLAHHNPSTVSSPSDPSTSYQNTPHHPPQLTNMLTHSGSIRVPSHSPPVLTPQHSQHPEPLVRSSSYHASPARVSPDSSIGTRYEYEGGHPTGAASVYVEPAVHLPRSHPYHNQNQNQSLLIPSQHSQQLQHPHSHRPRTLSLSLSQVQSPTPNPTYQTQPPPYEREQGQEYEMEMEMEPPVAYVRHGGQLHEFAPQNQNQNQDQIQTQVPELSQQQYQQQPESYWQDVMMNETGVENWNVWFLPGDGYFVNAATDESSWYTTPPGTVV